MKVLVVGGNRFVGLEVVTRLLLAGHEVTILALDPPPEDVAPHVRWIHVNRNQQDAVTRALDGLSFDAVVDNIAYEPQHVEILLRALPGRIGRFVLTSTVDIYGLTFPRTWREEQAPLEPSDLGEGSPVHERYPRGKRGCEKVLIASDLEWTVLRPCIVTGRRDNVTPPPGLRHLGPWEEASRSLFFPPRVLDGGPILMRQDDEGVFKLVWVQDVARAVTHVLGDRRSIGQAYNVTGDEVWTNERLVRALYAAAGREPDLVWVPARLLQEAGLGDYDPAYGRGPYWSAAENGKLRALGWTPTSPEVWLAKLVEAQAGAGQRPTYERRLQEIALAEHVRRRQGGRMKLQPVRPRAHVEEPRLAGRLTTEASRHWEESLPERRPGLAALHPSHFHQLGEGTVSGIGVGTWMGDLSAATDRMYVETLVHAVKSGINVLDTAINYRHMKAERCVGQALRILQNQGISREAVCVATKGGFVTHDAADPRSGHDYVRDQYVQPGLLPESDWHRGHSLAPRFLRAQLEQSLRNLGLQHADVYFLHNPELARQAYGAEAFRRQLVEAFAVLEEAVAAGKIGRYGLATWEALRVAPEHPQHVALGEALDAARTAAGGDGHHFQVVQLPFNAQKAEAYSLRNHDVYERRLSALRAAEDLGLYVFTSATMLQGDLRAGEVEERLPQWPGATLAARCLQFSRSTPGVGTALVGMRRVAHVDEALAVATRAPLAFAALDALCA